MATTNSNNGNHELADESKEAKKRIETASSSNIPYKKPRLLNTTRPTVGQKKIPNWVFDL